MALKVSASAPARLTCVYSAKRRCNGMYTDRTHFDEFNQFLFYLFHFIETRNTQPIKMLVQFCLLWNNNVLDEN